MGLEATCTARIGRRKVEGKAQLETSEIRFHGEPALKIPFAKIRSVAVKAGRLEIAHEDGIAVFELGDQAERWAEKIKSPKSRLDKLGVKPGLRVAVSAVEDDDFARELADRGIAPLRAAAKDLDLVFLGARTRADLAKLAAWRARLKPAGAIWVVWPKGRPELKEDHVRAAALTIDLVDVKVAAFSETLSALKLVIPVAKR